MSNETTRNSSNNWSPKQKDLVGRLRVQFEDLKPGLRYAIYLELKNEGFNPIAVINNPEITAELRDSSGNQVDTLTYSANGPSPLRQWGVIPGAAYLSFRIDTRSSGVPTRDQGMVLLALGGRRWGLRSGSYVLKATALFKAEDDGPPNQWVGELDLPTVEVIVTPKMFEVE